MLAQNFTSIQTSAGLPALHLRNVGGWIEILMPYVFSVVGMGMLVFLLLGGLQLMTSRGDPKAVEAAKAKITTSIIGVIIVFSSFALVKLIGSIFGLTIFGTIFGGTGGGPGR